MNDSLALDASHHDRECHHSIDSSPLSIALASMASAKNVFGAAFSRANARSST
jgi:hypothetical protein